MLNNNVTTLGGVTLVLLLSRPPLLLFNIYHIVLMYVLVGFCFGLMTAKNPLTLVFAFGNPRFILWWEHVQVLGMGVPLRIGHGEIYCGDALEVLKQIPSDSVDIILTDPPYGLGQDKYDDGEVFFRAEDELYRVAKRNAWLVFFWSTKKLPKAFELRRFKYVWQIVVSKASGHYTPSPLGFTAYQSVLVFKKGNPKVENRYRDLLFMNTLPAIVKKGMPRQFKSIHVVESLLFMFSSPNAVILDPFAGYGSIPFASERNKRRWIAVEIDNEKCEIMERLLGLMVEK